MQQIKLNLLIQIVPITQTRVFQARFSSLYLTRIYSYYTTVKQIKNTVFGF